MFTIRNSRSVTMQRLLALTLALGIAILCAGCGTRMQSMSGQTPSQVEQANPDMHLHSSTVEGDTETRIYRNWQWSSVGSYFKPNRTYRLVFINGMLSSWAAQ